jgi:hypothetical protein
MTRHRFYILVLSVQTPIFNVADSSERSTRNEIAIHQVQKEGANGLLVYQEFLPPHKEYANDKSIRIQHNPTLVARRAACVAAESSARRDCDRPIKLLPENMRFHSVRLDQSLP